MGTEMQLAVIFTLMLCNLNKNEFEKIYGA